MHTHMCTNACKCVCVSDLPVPLHITKATRVDVGLLVMSKTSFVQLWTGVVGTGCQPEAALH